MFLKAEDLAIKLSAMNETGQLSAPSVTIAAAYIDHVAEAVMHSVEGGQIRQPMILPMRLDGECYHPDCDSEVFGMSCYCGFHFNLYHRNRNIHSGLCSTCHARTGILAGNIATCDVCKGF